MMERLGCAAAVGAEADFFELDGQLSHDLSFDLNPNPVVDVDEDDDDNSATAALAAATAASVCCCSCC